MKSLATKHTVYIDGRKTGISLEDAFWSTLQEIAQAQGATVSQTVTTSRAKGETCPRRSACSYSTGSAVDKWVSRSRRSGRASTFGNDLKPK
jgi:Ribbon-helix-helix domain